CSVSYRAEEFDRMGIARETISPLRCSKSPMAGRAQIRVSRFSLRLLLAMALVFLPWAGRCHASTALRPCPNHVSADQQIELGHKVAEQVFQQMPVLP